MKDNGKPNKYGRVIKFDGSTRTAQEAADRLGCKIEQIAKSIIFRTKMTALPVLVIASGGNRVEEEIINQLLGEEIGKADADFVRDRTGFVIGGVPPFGHKEKIKTFVDEDLRQYDRIWASAGATDSVFETTVEELVEKSGGKVVRIKIGKK
jgi:prolyl-tRNA editing enzyme YbaK/EbsC (Cys-tRNA(Pro) deacylase)